MNPNILVGNITKSPEYYLIRPNSLVIFDYLKGCCKAQITIINKLNGKFNILFHFNGIGNFFRLTIDPLKSVIILYLIRDGIPIYGVLSEKTYLRVKEF